MTGSSTTTLRLEGLAKQFGEAWAVDHVDLEVAAGEFVTLLGPSGSGKTTTLRMIAGFTEPTAGSIELGDRDVTRLPAYRRDIGMVFQNYALFPHMTAGQNIAFPLEMRGMPKRVIKERVGAALASVRLDGLADRYPRQLSGGQQQRVAVARALVFEPHLLLMDEPLGALDKRLRENLQLEVKRIHSELGITIVYVTHDQDEALALSDRIAIFNGGRIEQVGTAEDLYERPTSLFVASFVGDANVFRGTIASDTSGSWLRSQGLAIPLADTRPASGERAALVIRPERIQLVAVDSPASADSFLAPGCVRGVTYMGADVRYEVEVGAAVISTRVPIGTRHKRWAFGDPVAATWSVDDAVVVPDTDPPDARLVDPKGTE